MNEHELRLYWRVYQTYRWDRTKSDWREGQRLMNALREVAPVLYDMVSGTAADCFNDDSRVSRFRRVMGFDGDTKWAAL